MATFWKPGTSQPHSTEVGTTAKALTHTNAVKAGVSGGSTPKLSKGVLSMKFMKQKEGNVEKQAEHATTLTVSLDRTICGDLECSTAHFDFVAAMPGRRSFNGCNKAVERHYEQVLDDLNYKRKTSAVKTDTISDEEMLKRYESLIGLPRGPNQGKKPDNRPINKQESGYGNKRGNNANKDHSNKKGKFR